MADQKMREGDTLTLEAKVARVSDDGREAPIEVWGAEDHQRGAVR